MRRRIECLEVGIPEQRPEGFGNHKIIITALP
jgi:hypothetical protein